MRASASKISRNSGGVAFLIFVLSLPPTMATWPILRALASPPLAAAPREGDVIDVLACDLGGATGRFRLGEAAQVAVAGRVLGPGVADADDLTRQC